MHKFIPVCEPLLLGKELEYVGEAVKTGWISSVGKYVAAFEQAFAAYCGAKHGIAVCNGTVALHLALTALGIGKGDEVIIPDFTMIASAFAVCYTGATPVFVDADIATWNLRPDLVEHKINKNTKAVMAVHVFGNPCDMSAIQAICDKHGLVLIEDAAEAHGATCNGIKTGALSRIAAFSFYANKNLTTGEGGIVVTSDDALAQRCRYFKNMCFNMDGPRNYLHDDIGFNYRMSNMHAAVGLAQTECADELKTLRQTHGKHYRERLALIPGIQLQQDQENAENVFWMNGIVVRPEYGRTRDALMRHLKENEIDTRLFFNGMHRQPSLAKYGCDCTGAYPVSDLLADNGFYLPSGSGLTEDQIDHVCDIIAGFRG